LPDVLTRPFYILFPQTFWVVQPLHSPVGLLFLCGLGALAFESSYRKTAFWNLLGGAYLHLFLDFFQKHVTNEYYSLFPFSWRTFEIGLFWPEESLAFIPWVLLAVTLMELSLTRIRRRG